MFKRILNWFKEPEQNSFYTVANFMLNKALLSTDKISIIQDFEYQSNKVLTINKIVQKNGQKFYIIVRDFGNYGSIPMMEYCNLQDMISAVDGKIIYITNGKVSTKLRNDITKEDVIYLYFDNETMKNKAEEMINSLYPMFDNIIYTELKNILTNY